jgi:hypothetical protein
VNAAPLISPPTVIGCVLSEWIVGRPVLFYALFIALLAAVKAIAWYSAPVAVPHTLFYVIILALPYRWWSGLLIVPLLIVIGRVWRVASAHPLDDVARRTLRSSAACSVVGCRSGQ